MVVNRDKIRDQIILLLYMLMKKPRPIRGDINKDKNETNS